MKELRRFTFPTSLLFGLLDVKSQYSRCVMIMILILWKQFFVKMATYVILNMIYQFTSFVCFIITVAAFEFFVTVTFSMSFQIVQLICRKGTLITSVSWSKVLVRCNQMSIQLRFIFKDAFAKFTAL